MDSNEHIFDHCTCTMIHGVYETQNVAYGELQSVENHHQFKGKNTSFLFRKSEVNADLWLNGGMDSKLYTN